MSVADVEQSAGLPRRHSERLKIFAAGAASNSGMKGGHKRKYSANSTSADEYN
jgi:hypothetical protein